MDNLLIPIHQYEIRFDPILNINTISREVLGPYIQRTTTFKIENEGSVNERINLIFDGYTIALWWDRLILTANNGIEGFNNANSPIEEPFFAILNKLIGISTFGRVKNSVFYLVGVKTIELDYRNTFRKITNKFLNSDGIQDLNFDFNDLSIVLMDRNEAGSIALNYGPYRDIQDFVDRNVKPSASFEKELENVNGTFFEYTVVSNLNNSFNFKAYRNQMGRFQSQIKNL